ncbi:MAG: PilZ domain-containing protein [Kofleriaceae bacterium]
MRTLRDWTELQQDEGERAAMFVPTTTPCAEGDEVVIEVSSPALPNKVLIRGEVRWWRAARPRNRVRAGALVVLADGEAGKRVFVREVVAGERAEVRRRRQSRLPVSLPARYRTAGEPAWHPVAITELSAGGALLATSSALELDAELTIEVMPPGAAVPLAIAARSSYVGAGGSTGVRFVSRDGDGARRLRELVRRVRAA